MEKQKLPMEKQKLPNETIVMVLGIASILLSCCCAFFGFIPGIIGMVLANKSIKLYNKNPDQYEGLGNAKTGKIINTIGIVLSLIMTVYFIYAMYQGIQEYGGWDAYIQTIKDGIESGQYQY